ncbi:MAG: chaperone modulator CbpM [Alphaproteobacteria bacterium]
MTPSPVILTEEQVVARVSRLTATQLRVWIREGWIVPAETDRGPCFDEADVARINLVCQLRDDLGLDDSGLPVVLSLIDQIHGLRQELKALAQAIEDEPADVQQRIAEGLRRRTRP